MVINYDFWFFWRVWNVDIFWYGMIVDEDGLIEVDMCVGNQFVQVGVIWFVDCFDVIEFFFCSQLCLIDFGIFGDDMWNGFKFVGDVYGVLVYM